jgi:hypothetical protein
VTPSPCELATALVRRWQTTGQAPPPSTSPSTAPEPPPPRFEYLGVPLNLDDDVYPIAQGMTYRALVSVSANYTKAQIGQYLATHGYAAVTLWEPTELLPVDWPSEDLSSGLEPNHRWLRGEATRTGASDVIDRVSTIHVLVTVHAAIYRIAAMWKKVPAPDAGLVIGPAAGPHGLDPDIPTPIASAVVEAYVNETDPDKLKQLATTMRQAGLFTAASVLGFRAAALEAGGMPSASSRASARSKAGGAALFAAVLGALATALRKH